MKKNSAISLLFWVSAVYDGVLGAAFLVAAGAIFEWSQTPAPNHLGYVQFPGALLIVFGLMFATIARKPAANRGLIPYGILLKVSYCGVVFFYWFTSGIPMLWKPFAVVDLITAVLFAWAYVGIKERDAN